MYLTRDEIGTLPTTAFRNRFVLINAISDRFACGISNETADRIIADYRATLEEDAKNDCLENYA